MNDIHTLHVGLGARAYPIKIGSGTLTSLGQTIHDVHQGRSLFIISDTQVSEHYQSKIETHLRDADLNHFHWLSVPAGEASKSMRHFTELCETILRKGVERRDTIIALGGGVIGQRG